MDAQTRKEMVYSPDLRRREMTKNALAILKDALAVELCKPKAEQNQIYINCTIEGIGNLEEVLLKNNPKGE